MPVMKKKVCGAKDRKIEPVWKGPEKDGITQSLLSRFLVCRERFRIYAIEGLQPVEKFSHRLEYGQMWHTCEEAVAAKKEWFPDLLDYTKLLIKKYRFDGEKIEHWHNVCKKQFPVYQEFWSKQKDERNREPIHQEVTFCVPYELPSGRIVNLRGKWDAVDRIGKGRRAEVWLQENKTKGQINEEQLRTQLLFDLQTMMYIIALRESGIKVSGVRYNVVRRPLSGGKYTIRQHKPTKSNPQGESKEKFYDRLGDCFKDDPKFFFMRWKVSVSESDIRRFKREFFDPCLEYLCRWYCQVTTHTSHDDAFGLHWRMPYGIWNPLAKDGRTELDDYLNTGSEVGLERTKVLFPELEP
jgi:hypothetical protein